MKIKTNEFDNIRYPGGTILCDNETGLCLLQYEPPQKLAAPELKTRYYLNPNELLLVMPSVKPRCVLRVVNIIHSSQNWFRAIYSDAKGVETAMVKTYSELHAWLEPLWRR